MNKHSTVLYVRLHAGDVMLRRFRRENERSVYVCLSLLFPASFLFVTFAFHLSYPSIFSLTLPLPPQHTHTHTHSHSLSDEGEKCARHHTERLFYSCERLLCKTRARACSLEVSSQLRIIPALSLCVQMCLCSYIRYPKGFISR